MRPIGLVLRLLFLVSLPLLSCSHSHVNNEAQDIRQPETKVRVLANGPKSPIVFIPGDGGTQLQAKLNKTQRPHYVCDLKSDWYDIWLNIHLLTPVFFDCTSENMQLHYNSTTRKTLNTDGVDIRVTNFGALESVEYLDIWSLYLTDYFHKIIDTLEKNNGYTRNVNMVSAGYDFRKAPNELEGYFKDLSDIIETQYIRNNYARVTLICHSMGCLNSLYLLNRKSQDWKDVYIERLISLAAPWDGSFMAISAMLHGDNLGIPVLSRYKLQKLQSTFPSLMYLFPKDPSFQPDRMLIQTKSQNSTLDNMDQVFKRNNFIDQLNMWQDTANIAANLSAPNVELWCLYESISQTTVSKSIYDNDFGPDAKYTEPYSDGYGTVNLKSLRTCRNMRDKQTKSVYLRIFPNVDQIGILRGNEAANYISSEILAN